MKSKSILVLLAIILLWARQAGAEELKEPTLQFSKTSSSWLHIDVKGNIVDGGGPNYQELVRDYEIGRIEADKTYVLKAKKKHIDRLRDAANAIFSHGERWGLNDKFIEECRQALNNTQDIKKE